MRLEAELARLDALCRVLGLVNLSAGTRLVTHQLRGVLWDYDDTSSSLVTNASRRTSWSDSDTSTVVGDGSDDDDSGDESSEATEASHAGRRSVCDRDGEHPLDSDEAEEEEPQSPAAVTAESGRLNLTSRYEGDGTDIIFVPMITDGDIWDSSNRPQEPYHDDRADASMQQTGNDGDEAAEAQ